MSNMEHDWFLARESFDSEWQECKRCGLMAHYWEELVPCGSVTRCSYYGKDKSGYHQCVAKDE